MIARSVPSYPRTTTSRTPRRCRQGRLELVAAPRCSRTGRPTSVQRPGARGGTVGSEASTRSSTGEQLPHRRRQPLGQLVSSAWIWLPASSAGAGRGGGGRRRARLGRPVRGRFGARRLGGWRVCGRWWRRVGMASRSRPSAPAADTPRARALGAARARGRARACRSRSNSSISARWAPQTARSFARHGRSPRALPGRRGSRARDPLPGRDSGRRRRAPRVAASSAGLTGAAEQRDRDLGDLGRRAARRGRPWLSSASALAAAVPCEPDTIAPAWPIVLPGGAVKPAM